MRNAPVQLIVLLFLFLCAGLLCGSVAAAETVRIGVIAPLSGVRADAGAYMRHAIELASEEIRADSGKKKKLAFVYEDSKYEPLAAVTAAHKLIDLDNISLIIGPHSSSEVMAAAAVAEKAKVVLITPGALAEQISQAGDYIFRLAHNTAQEAPVIGEFIVDRMGSGTLHSLCIENPSSRSYIDHLRSVLQGRAMKLGTVEFFDPKETDFRAYLTKIKALAPTDVFLCAAPAQVPLIFEQARQIGLNVRFYNIGVEGPEMLAKPGLLEGLYYPYSYDSTSREPEVKKFHQFYVNRYGDAPDAVAANTYDAVMLLSRCLESTGSQGEKVKACLYSTRDHHGAGGTFSIDANGDAVRRLIVKTVKDNQFVPFAPSNP